MKALVEFELDQSWDDYKDCSDDVIFADLREGYDFLKIGVEAKLIKIDRESN